MDIIYSSMIIYFDKIDSIAICFIGWINLAFGYFAFRITSDMERLSQQ